MYTNERSVMSVECSDASVGIAGMWDHWMSLPFPSWTYLLWGYIIYDMMHWKLTLVLLS